MSEVRAGRNSDAKTLNLDEDALRRLSEKIASDVAAGRYLGGLYPGRSWRGDRVPAGPIADSRPPPPLTMAQDVGELKKNIQVPSGLPLAFLGHTASSRAFGAVGGGSTLLLVDPDRDLTFVFLSAGFIDGLDHFARLQQLSDLALAAVVD